MDVPARQHVQQRKDYNHLSVCMYEKKKQLAACQSIYKYVDIEVVAPNITFQYRGEEEGGVFDFPLL